MVLDAQELARWDGTKFFIKVSDAAKLLKRVKELEEAAEAISFQPEPHTAAKPDKWLILATRILRHMDRDDVADGLEAEYEAARARAEAEVLEDWKR